MESTEPTTHRGKASGESWSSPRSVGSPSFIQLDGSQRTRRTDLVVVTWTLAVFCQRFQSLVDESDVGFGDVEAEQTESTGRTAADAVEELQSLADHVVIRLVTLRPQVILRHTQ